MNKGNTGFLTAEVKHHQNYTNALGFYLMNSPTLNPILWLWIPLSIMIIQIGIELFVPDSFKTAVHSENGPHETLQFLFALGGLFYALRCLLRVSFSSQKILTFWLICFAVGCTYIAGEEVSWGQHIFNWATPEFWGTLNDQNETNLHNTSSWLDQKPRLLLLVGVITGGLIIPFLQRFKPSVLPKKFEMIYPPACLVPIAALALSIKIIDKIDDNLPDIVLFYRASEIEELFLFYFVLLYLIVLYRRIIAS